MASKAAYKRYQTIQKNPPPYIVAHPSESNILEWHYIITGPPDTPYHNGQYWGTLVFPPNYPFAPPAIRMHTPSGRFQPSTRLCLSISDFHPKSFNPAWEVSTILIGLLSFMTSEEMTTGSVAGTETERKWAATKSRWWNSTCGGSTKRSTETGMKTGDGGAKFRAEWSDLDEENWRWLRDAKVDLTNGNLPPKQSAAPCAGDASLLRQRPVGSAAPLAAAIEGGQAARDAGQSWVRRNKAVVAFMAMVTYVLISKLLQQVST